MGGAGARAQGLLPEAPLQREADVPEGVEVLARGPIHEAFAEPVVRGPRPTPVIDKRAPDPIEEMPPDQKPEGDNVQWLPGYWAWDDERADFLWVSGIWRAIPPEMEWVPGYWNQAADGWQWVSGYWMARTQHVQQFLPEPPDPVVEAVAAAPSVEHIYVPGCWVYYETRYLWRPGFWMLPRPGWLWVPAHYVWTPAGYIYVGGYWDFPLARRGLLFAPVYVQRPVLLGPRWVYRPSFVVRPDFLTGSLFVRLSTNHYYFGDYFDARYEQLGYTSWVDFRIGRSFHDPLYSYYRWEHRNNPLWERDLRQLYLA